MEQKDSEYKVVLLRMVMYFLKKLKLMEQQKVVIFNSVSYTHLRAHET